MSNSNFSTNSDVVASLFEMCHKLRDIGDTLCSFVDNIETTHASNTDEFRLQDKEDIQQIAISPLLIQKSGMTGSGFRG